MSCWTADCYLYFPKDCFCLHVEYILYLSWFSTRTVLFLLQTYIGVKSEIENLQQLFVQDNIHNVAMLIKQQQIFIS